MKRLHRALWLTGALLLSGACAAQAAPQSALKLDIEPQSIDAALNEFARQSGLQVILQTEEVRGLTSARLAGTFTAQEALARLLSNTDLSFEYLNDRTIAVRAKSATPVSSEARTATDEEIRLAQAGLPAEPSPSQGEGQGEDRGKNGNEEYGSESARRTIPEILVRGSRSSNTDIRRTESDIQPYIVLGQEEISKAQAMNLDDFLKTRLPMNTAKFSIDQESTPYVNSGQINLRGLGANQTLILVDGRRLPGVVSRGGDLAQPDISGIPLASIERIEILPTTASGIYGGSATGGAINIIRKKNYSGLDFEMKYGDVFNGDATSLELNVGAGGSFESGRTHVALAASYSKADRLLVSDRDFAFQARQRVLSNQPSSITGVLFPFAGTTSNICSARSATSGLCGSTPLVLDSGQSLGSPITYVPVGYAGPASDGGAALAANAGHYNLDIPSDGRALLRTPEKNSLSLNVRRQFGSVIEGFLDLAGNRNSSDLSTPDLVLSRLALPADSPNNPFQQRVIVQVNGSGPQFPAWSKNELVGGTAGVVARLPKEWAATLERSWSLTRTSFTDQSGSSPLTPTGQGVLAATALQDVEQPDLTPYFVTDTTEIGGPFDTVLDGIALRFSGPTVRLPAGTLNITASVERREEEAREAYFQRGALGTTFYPKRTQNVDSEYLEMRIPVIGSGQARRFARDLELQVAVRHDAYKTVSTSDLPTATTRDGPFASVNYSTNAVSSTDQTLGLRYAPIKALTVRASFGTGFLPAALSQITPTVSLLNRTSNLTDPKRGNTDSYVGNQYTVVSNGNADLQPEDSKSWSAGLILAPESIEGLRLSVDFTRIEKNGEIFSPGASFILQNEDIFPGRVVRGEKLPGDPAIWAGPITFIDQSLINLSGTNVRSYDFQFDYELKTENVGEFTFTTIATRMSQFERQLTKSSAAYDSVAFSDGPLRWKGQAILSWDRGPWTTSWSTQYYDNYATGYATPLASSQNVGLELIQGSATIPSQIYHDVWGRFRFGAASRFSALENVSVSFGIQNVFNTSPPLVALPSSSIRASGSYGYSTYGDPRLRRYMLSLQKSFSP